MLLRFFPPSIPRREGQGESPARLQPHSLLALPFRRGIQGEGSVSATLYGKPSASANAHWTMNAPAWERVNYNRMAVLSRSAQIGPVGCMQHSYEDLRQFFRGGRASFLETDQGGDFGW